MVSGKEGSRDVVTRPPMSRFDSLTGLPSGGNIAACYGKSDGPSLLLIGPRRCVRVLVCVCLRARACVCVLQKGRQDAALMMCLLPRH